MTDTRTVLISRHVLEAFGETPSREYFTFRGSGRARGGSVCKIEAEDMPAFEGHRAWFEVERIPARPSAKWRVVRARPDIPLPPPGQTYPG